MAGIAVIDDDFTGLVSGTTISARVPPTNDGGYSYAVDPDTLGATGGGSGDVKFSGAGVGVKIRSLIGSGASYVVMDDKGGNEEFGLFTRDIYSTPYPRQGYIAIFRTRSLGGTNGVFYAGVEIFYNTTWILEAVPWTYASSGINTVALESIGNTHRVIINNAVAGTFTDSTWPQTANTTRYGVVYHSGGTPSVMRMNRFSVYDSIVITASPAYPIVTVA